MWAPVPQPGVRPQPPALTMWKLTLDHGSPNKGVSVLFCLFPLVVILDETKISHHKFKKCQKRKIKKHFGFNLSLPTHYLHVNTILHNEKKKLAKISFSAPGKQNRNKQTKKQFCLFFFNFWLVAS